MGQGSTLPRGRGLAVVVIGLMAAAAMALAPGTAHTVNPAMVPPCTVTPDPVTQGQAAIAREDAFMAVGIIVQGQYYLGAASPDPGVDTHVDWSGLGGVEMSPSDGFWDSDTETLQGTIDTTPLAPGTHTVWIHAKGSNGVWSHPDSCDFVVQSPSTDTWPPDLLNLTFLPDGVIGPSETTVDFQVDIDGTVGIIDTNIAGAGPSRPRYWVGGCGEGIIAPAGYLTAVDGSYDETFEQAIATIDTSSWLDGTWWIHVMAEDLAGNQPLTCASAPLIVNRGSPDTASPKASAGTVFPATINVGGGPVSLAAVIDDTTTGATPPVFPEYFVEPTDGSPPFADGTGATMLAADGAFDEANETVVVPSLDVSTWPAGVYTFHFHGRDNVGNWGSWSVADEHTAAVLTIGTPVPDSPTGVTAAVSGADLVISWTPPADPAGLDHFVVYRDASPTVDGCPGGSAVAVATPAASATSFTDAGRAADAGAYFYVVRSANSLGQEDAGCEMVGKTALDLPRGVSEISTPFLPTLADPASFFQPLGASFVGVGAYGGGSWSFYNASGGGALAVLDNTMGLRVVLSAAGRLPLVGHVPVSAADRAITLSGVGWHFVGAPTFAAGGLALPGAYDANGLVNAWDRVLAGRSDAFDPWQQYHAVDPAFRDLAGITGGRGYWIRIQTAGAFTWTPPLL